MHHAVARRHLNLAGCEVKITLLGPLDSNSESLAHRRHLLCPAAGCCVADVQTLKVETSEHPPDVRVVIDADHHPALAAPHEVGHALVLLEREVDSIAGGLPVGGSM